ncbi:hypothetical protein [Campylobacter jejuni]|nr:hypothetical protein [Campylobacter jejuni]
MAFWHLLSQDLSGLHLVLDQFQVLAYLLLDNSSSSFSKSL